MAAEIWKNPRVEVVPYDEQWLAMFEAASGELHTALGPLVVDLHHIGSTAVPGLAAKPVIDMLLEVLDVTTLDDAAVIEAMEEIGYHAQGEYGIPGRRYFVRGKDPRTHQVHAFSVGSEQITRHIAFRDYMRVHPDIAREYAKVKQRAAAAANNDIETYMDGKDAFIKEHEAKALTWAGH